MSARTQGRRALAMYAALLLMPLATARGQEEWSPDRADAHVPLSLLGYQELARGEMAFSYRYVRDYFSDYRQSAFSTLLEPVTAEELLSQYPTVPKRMTQHSHRLGAAFAPRDGLVFMAELPVHAYRMDVLTDADTGYAQSSSGIGDLSIVGSYRVLNWSRQRLDLHVGTGVPTGSLDPADTTIDALPYAMRLGLGTWSLKPGFTYLGQNTSASWGFQVAWTIPIGRNARDYRLGRSHQGSAWISGNWARWISSSFRIVYRSQRQITGADPALDPAASPLNETEILSQRYVDGWIGTNIMIPSGLLKGQRLSVEIGYPLYVDVNSLRSRWYLTAGWQYAFRLLGR